MKIQDYFLTQEIFEVQEVNPGILKTSPIPKNIDKYYNSIDYISHHQDRNGVRQRLYKFLQKFNLNYKKNILSKFIALNAEVLDYGCGAGEFLKSIEKDYQTIGYEPNPSAREAAKKKITNTKILDDVNSVPDQFLDAITMWHVLEHIENQEEMLNIFHNKLKNNGLLVIAVPNHTSHDAEYYKQYWAAWDVPRHIYHFSKNGIEQFFNNSKWALEKQYPLLLDSFYISVLSEKYKKNALPWLYGTVRGVISNIKASKNGEFSSVIYIIRKK